MYDRIPTILTPSELLDKALGRASKIHKEDPEYEYRVKKTTLSKIESSVDVLVETLRGFVRHFPNLERIGSYERELIDVVLGVRALQRALSRVEGGADTIERLGRLALGDARRSRDPKDLFATHRRIVGRASSVVGDLGAPLKFLANARAVLKAIPEVTPGDATIVVAGHPNVGKSSLLARLTNARPDIAPYAFTTKQINVGHFHWPETTRRSRRYQIVDTPGLLEKMAAERNAIEKQAALALAYLADLIVFVFDPSEACGYPMTDQEGLYASVRNEFKGIPIYRVATKSDLKRRPSADLAVSAETGEGLAELKKRIVAALPADPYEGLVAQATEPSSGKS